MSENMIFEIYEVVEQYDLDEGFIRRCIDCEWIIPCDCENNNLDNEDIARMLLIKDLLEDFGVNDESVPLILHLIDQIHSLHARLRRFMDGDGQVDL